MIVKSVGVLKIYVPTYIQSEKIVYCVEIKYVFKNYIPISERISTQINLKKMLILLNLKTPGCVRKKTQKSKPILFYYASCN